MLAPLTRTSFPSCSFPSREYFAHFARTISECSTVKHVMVQTRAAKPGRIRSGTASASPGAYGRQTDVSNALLLTTDDVARSLSSFRLASVRGPLNRTRYTFYIMHRTTPT